MTCLGLRRLGRVHFALLAPQTWFVTSSNTFSYSSGVYRYKVVVPNWKETKQPTVNVREFPSRVPILSICRAYDGILTAAEHP
jgi:hypothetical protein